jgi:acetaldehyde dehydrogenase/alcohol dehydrogenase
LSGNSEDEKVAHLIGAIESLKASLDLAPSVESILGKEKKDAYFAAIPHMAEMAFDDQCTAANPRYPLIADFESLFKAAWYGAPKK